MKKDIKHYAPPGVDIGLGVRYFIIALIVSFLVSLSYIYCFWQELEALKEGASSIMPDFVDILGGSMVGFLFIGMFMIEALIYFYVYHRLGGSNTLYVMRRLPRRYELHRRCITMPLLGMAVNAAVSFLLLFLYFYIYMAVTPPEFLTANQWEKIWRAYQ